MPESHETQQAKSISSIIPQNSPQTNNNEHNRATNLKVLTWNPNSLKCQLNDNGYFFFKSYFKIKKLLAKGTTIAIQDANLNLRAVKLLTSNFNTFYSPQNKGLLTITPKDTLILDTETHKNNRIKKNVQIDKEKNKIL